LSGPSRLRLLYLSHLSQPAIDRPIYRAIRQKPVQKIVELGIGDCQRTLRMLEIAGIHRPLAEICYAGIDLFETRKPGDVSGLTLKRAFQLLRATGARIRLIPGDPFTALSRAANLLEATDLLVISADQDPDSLSKAWYFVPRMLHAQSRVFLAEAPAADGSSRLRQTGLREINQFVHTIGRRRAA
jgi:hypothetical protein